MGVTFPRLRVVFSLESAKRLVEKDEMKNGAALFHRTRPTEEEGGPTTAVERSQVKVRPQPAGGDLRLGSAKPLASLPKNQEI